MEELQSTLQNWGLRVSNSPLRGRCLFTSRDFSPGEVIISQDPYVSVANNSPNELRCDGCFRSGNLKRCSACQGVWYCGTTCQKLDWKLHRLECSSLSNLGKERRKSVEPSIRLIVRLYLRRKLQVDKIIPSTATDNYDLIEALVTHMKEIDEKRRLLYAQMANIVASILQWPDINIKDIAENFSKLSCNAHTITDGELRPLGVGLHPVISILNHSCLPNAVLAFDGRQAVVRSVKPIPKGTEVFISYIETAGSTITRQKTLQQQYFFSCSCPRCSKSGEQEDIQENAILEGYRCTDDRCNGFLLRDSGGKGFVCQHCGCHRRDEEVNNLAAEIQAISKMASQSISSCNDREAVSICRSIEKLQMKLCHPFAISLMKTRETLLKMLMELEDWKGALSYSKLTIPVYERVYTEFHPLLGSQYYTRGKLEWLLGDTENAIKSLTKALDILRNIPGTETHLMKELMLKLKEAQAEGSYKRTANRVL